MSEDKYQASPPLNDSQQHPDNLSHESIEQSSESQSSTSNAQPQHMEVHHHGHVHEQKKWKEYLFQFFMLFLAVFCGFLAEYQLEHVIENSREKEFIRSLIQNVKEDTVELNIQLKRNKERIKGMDSLVRLARADHSLPENLRSVYLLYLNHVPYSNLFKTNDATMQQLKNAGGLRLVRKGHAADSIVKYDANNKAISSQEQYYVSSVTHAMEASYDVMDQTIFIDTSYFFQRSLTAKIPPPLTTDTERLRVLFNTVMIHQLITSKYNLLMEQQLKYARTFIPYLQKQYKLQEN